MASVHHEVLRLGGTLSVKSEAERGTCWRITLPTSNAQGADVESGDERLTCDVRTG
jgi:chemotaxis protein histidine kinase CheA